jgi:TonB-linked SusC/RagA family outer membrane protein
VGVDYVINNLNEFNASSIEGALPVNESSAYSSKSTHANLLSENTLTYKKEMGQHHIEVLAGYTAQLNTTESVDAFSKGHLNTQVITVNAGSPNDRLAHAAKYESSYASLLGRINYSFNDKYLFTANIRRDGSSVFSSENKYGIFPSFSAGWRISQEAFMAGLPFISDLKLRGSWGQVGIDGGLGGSEYATIGSGYLYNFGGIVVPGLTPNVIPNPGLKWETVSQTDFGIDVSILNNKLNLTADYFEKKYSDMITQKVVPIYGGISTPDAGGTVSQSVNSANVTNKGFELAINFQNKVGILYYNIGANFTTFNNKVVKLEDYLVGGNTGNTPQGMLTRTQEGNSVGEFYGWVVDGIFQNAGEVNAANELDKDPATYYQTPLTAPGDIRFKDLNGDNVISDKDRTFIGSPIPKFVYALNGELKMLQFDLNFSLQGSQGNKIINANRFVTESSAGTQNKSSVMLNRWTPANPSNTVPRVNFTDPNFNDRPSDRFVEDGSYVRLRSIQLGYSLQSKVIQRAKLSSVRLYLTATNLFTITDYTGYNPDIGSQNNQNMNNGVDDTIYPQNRSVLAGISIGF